MAFQPRTLRNPEPDQGERPCIHFGDTANSVLQVHHDPSGIGMYFSAVVLHPVFGPMCIDVELTPGQVNDLMDYLRAEA